MTKNIIEAKHSDVDDIKEDINSLKSNTIELARHVKEAGSHKTEDITEAASKRFKALTTQGKEQLKNMESKIKAKPLQSIAVAFIAGLVFDALLKRR
ncbi:MAG: hypothetical protein GW903_08815 [Alphaproteobacteria bacterium]|nr:hypothetical protein [Alphaproteobacteria bacterium]NCQ88909.1 hypothetical protein [Alphaproteobacteria bacterium]NCT07812.1 hypothetical protein [Alphaproteobacteria bacterium]